LTLMVKAMANSFQPALFLSFSRKPFCFYESFRQLTVDMPADFPVKAMVSILAQHCACVGAK
jgi:hypothetical protein